MKKVISFVLVLVMMWAMVVPAYADDLKAPPATNENIQETVEVLKEAVQSLDQIFDQKQAAGFMEVIQQFGESFKAAMSYAAAINSGVVFLRLIGVMKDSGTEALKSIMQQMAVIGEQITAMDKKLDAITEKMNEMQASQEFNARTQKAISFENSWKDFEYRYMENGLDQLIAKYNSMMLNGLQAWCKNEGNARTANGIDNSVLVLSYEKTDKGYQLIYTTQNGRPDAAKAGARVLVLDADILPKSIQWNVNTYRETIKKEIIKNLKAVEDFSTLNAENFPKTLDDALLDAIGEDAVNLLTYRATAGQLNADSEFSLQVVREFNNFCTHLIGTNEGIDAITKVLFFTHAFEYQIKDDFTDLMNQMIVKSGVYGSFVLNVVGMSDFITDAEKVAVLDTYCNTILTVEKKQREGLTGNDNFCYVTNKNLCFGTISFTEEAEMKTKHRGTVRGYIDSKMKDTVISITYGLRKNTGEAAQLIGDSDAILLSYYLDGDHGEKGYTFFNEKLGQGAAKDYGKTVVGLAGSQSLPTNSNDTLSVTNVLGSYFNGKSVTKLSSLPSGASTGELVSRRMMNGSWMDTATGSVSTNHALSAIAIYGENHWYWEKDEAAFLGGPVDFGEMTKSYSKKVTDVEFPTTEIETAYYKQTVSYNCLINEAAKHQLSVPSTSEGLSSFEELCKEIRESVKEDEPKAETEEGGFNFALFGIIAAAVILCAGVVVAVVLVKKKKSKAK